MKDSLVESPAAFVGRVGSEGGRSASTLSTVHAVPPGGLAALPQPGIGGDDLKHSQQAGCDVLRRRHGQGKMLEYRHLGSRRAAR